MLGKKLCSNCKTGKDSFEMDKNSGTCPYIYCYEDNTCSFYEPLETEKKSLWDKLSGMFASRK